MSFPSTEENWDMRRSITQLIRQKALDGCEIPHGLIDVQIIMGAMGQGRMEIIVTAVGA